MDGNDEMGVWPPSLPTSRELLADGVVGRAAEGIGGTLQHAVQLPVGVGVMMTRHGQTHRQADRRSREQDRSRQRI